MTTKIKASLEDAISKWSATICESDDWRAMEVWWPESLIPRMADAAYQVLMMNTEAQKFMGEQEGDE